MVFFAAECILTYEFIKILFWEGVHIFKLKESMAEKKEKQPLGLDPRIVCLTYNKDSINIFWTPNWSLTHINSISSVKKT